MKVKVFLLALLVGGAWAIAPASAGASTKVSCTGIAPFTRVCEGYVPESLRGGHLEIDLGGLVQKGTVTLAAYEQTGPGRFADTPAWECTAATADEAFGCESLAGESSPHAFKITARLADGAVGKWGWTWMGP